MKHNLPQGKLPRISPANSRREVLPCVLHIVTALDFGGLESRMVLLAESADSSGFRHVFCSLTDGGHAAERLLLFGADVRLLGGQSRLGRIGAALRLASLIREIRPCIVHSHGAEANLVGILTASALRVPVKVSEEIGIPQHSLRGRVIFRVVHGLATTVVAVSEATKQVLVDTREVTASRCEVLESPARLRTPRPPVRRNKFPTIAFVGRLEPIKNPLELVEAVALVNAEAFPLRLIVVGEGSLRSRIEEQLRTSGFGDRITLKGFCPRPFEVVGGVDLLVQPSISEGMSMALVEAMSQGIPPLVSPVGGANEIVEEGVTGWFFGALDARGIASRLIEVLSKPSRELNQIGKTASDSVSDRFSPDAYVAQLDRLYTDALARPRIL